MVLGCYCTCCGLLSLWIVGKRCVLTKKNKKPHLGKQLSSAERIRLDREYIFIKSCYQIDPITNVKCIKNQRWAWGISPNTIKTNHKMMLDFDPDNEKLRQPRSDKGSCLIALKKNASTFVTGFSIFKCGERDYFFH